jgi:hypothetical protein
VSSVWTVLPYFSPKKSHGGSQYSEICGRINLAGFTTPRVYTCSVCAYPHTFVHIRTLPAHSAAHCAGVQLYAQTRLLLHKNCTAVHYGLFCTLCDTAHAQPYTHCAIVSTVGAQNCAESHTRRSRGLTSRLWSFGCSAMIVSCFRSERVTDEMAIPDVRSRGHVPCRSPVRPAIAANGRKRCTNSATRQKMYNTAKKKETR